MSLAEPQQAPERRLSPGLTVNLPTNNPFRKGPNSPALGSPALATPPERPSSRNPFLDQSPERMSGASQQKTMSPLRATNGRNTPPTQRPTGTAGTGDLLATLSFNDQPTANGNRSSMAPPRTANRPPQTENLPPLKHRPSRSYEEEARLRNAGKPRGPEQGLDIFADPPQVGGSTERRPRRNSESSVAEKNGKPLDPEEEKKRRERRQREREARPRDSKGRPIPTANGTKSKKPSHRLDVIDKLDVTSIYGTGLFHHDGPFDACNPHRNRKGSSRAPMQAFPKDSANNVIGGSGPVNKNINLDQFHGRGADGFADYSAAGSTRNAPPIVYEPYAGTGIPYRGDARPGVDRTSSFNATAKVDLLHGDESMGLGTSTFLEGAPAARSAIQRRESDGEYATAGISRTKSIAQKIRGIRNERKEGGQRGISSPEPRYERTTSPSETPGAGPLGQIRETNPFDNAYNDAYDKKGANIKVAEQQAQDGDDMMRRSRTLSNSNGSIPAINVLERKATNDAFAPAVPPTDGEGKSGGFLSRVKSLRSGGRGKPRVERRETSS